MQKLVRYAIVIFVLVLPAPALAQVAVGYSASGKLVAALNGLALSLDATKLTNTIADARLPVLMTGHTATSWTLGSNLAGGGFKGTGFVTGTASGQLVTADYSWTCSTGLAGCGDFTAARTLRIADTAVTPTTYPATGRIPTFTVNQQGQLILAGDTTDGSALTGVTANTATTLVLAGQTLWAAPVVGEVGYLSGDGTWSRCNAAAGGTINCQSTYQGTASTVTTGGAPLLLLEAGLTPIAGDALYASDTTAGRVTNVQPSTTAHYVQQVGTLVSASGYVIGTGTALRSLFRPGLIAGPLPL